MSQAEDLLNSLAEDEVAVASAEPKTEPHIVINKDRTVTVPEELKHIAVEGDHNIETVTFDCPRYWDGHDLSEMNMRIVFQRPDGHKEPHPVENPSVDETDINTIHFDWTLSKNVTLVRGNISFTVCAKIADAEGIVDREWHTRLNQDLVVDEGMDCSGDEIVEQNPDIIESILVRLDLAEQGGASDEQIAAAVEAYMTEHPVEVPDSGQNVAQVEPAEDDIPKVFFMGVAPATKEQDELPLYMEYRSKTKTIKSYCTLKVQGDSSAKYAKHNFNIKLYADEERTEKQKVVFRDWLKTHKYCMKANWIDHTHARNVVNGRLWNQVVRSRADIASYPAEYQASPHSGAVDGFPVKVYINGVYQGIYTWNIRKDESMFNMDDGTGTHAALIADANSNVTIWRALPSIDGTDWTDELNDVVPDAVLTGFRNAYSFVMNSTDEEFKTNIEQYFYKSSLIDYYIFIYSILMVGGLAKSQTMFTYDAQKFLANIYDMDTTWALMWHGSDFYDVEFACPDDYISQAALAQNNLLYERVSALFADEIRERYAELRNTVLSNANIINEFERFMDVIPADLYKEDYAETTADGAFTAIPSKTTNTLQKLRDIIVKRMAYVDNKINRVACTGVTISKKELSFTEDTEETLTVTVTPDGCTDTVKWASNATDVAVVKDGVVRPVSAGTATITVTCGEYSDSCVVTVEDVEAAVVADGLLFDLDLTKATAENLNITDNTGNVTAKINKAESIAENGGVCVGQGYSQSVNATWVNAPEFGNEHAVEIVSFGFPWHPALSFGIDAHSQDGQPLGAAISGLKLKAKYKNADGESVELPYTNQGGNCSIQLYLDDGTSVVSSVANLPDAHKDKVTHIVVNFNADGTTTVYDNGYPCITSPAAENFASWDMSSVSAGFGAWNGPASTDRILRSLRMYNRTLTKAEVRNNRDFELKKL